MSIPRLTLLSTVASLVLPMASACSRALPQTWPDASPASIASEPLAPATVTLALDEDPPLPGQAKPGWDGLAEPKGGGHHHHHGHGQMPSKAAEPSAPINHEGAGHAH